MAENEQLIANLNYEMAMLQNHLHENQEKLQRLNRAKHAIITEQEALSVHKKLIAEPDLSPSSWAGKHATEFLNIRENIEQSYMAIVTQQVEDILAGIEEKVAQLESANSGLSNSIASHYNRIDDLNNL